MRKEVEAGEEAMVGGWFWWWCLLRRMACKRGCRVSFLGVVVLCIRMQIRLRRQLAIPQSARLARRVTGGGATMQSVGGLLLVEMAVAVAVAATGREARARNVLLTFLG